MRKKVELKVQRVEKGLMLRVRFREVLRVKKLMMEWWEHQDKGLRRLEKANQRSPESLRIGHSIAISSCSQRCWSWTLKNLRTKIQVYNTCSRKWINRHRRSRSSPQMIQFTTNSIFMAGGTVQPKSLHWLNGRRSSENMLVILSKKS